MHEPIPDTRPQALSHQQAWGPSRGTEFKPVTSRIATFLAEICSFHREHPARNQMSSVNTMEYDLKFVCSECGKVATRVRILEPGEVPEAQDEFWSNLTSDTRRLCIEVDGLQGWTSQRTGSPEEILRDWLAEDFQTLLREDEMQVANRCFDCEKWYCGDHGRWERVVYGAPAYDYYFEIVCPGGHERTVER
jgi:hypothetical protein